MIKKVIALAATALFSLSASAGYVEYDFGGPMSGYFIQNDANQSIADFNFSFPVAGAPSSNPNGFQLGLSPQHSEGSTEITSATTYFRNNGPTNFSIYSDFGGDQFTNFSVDFSRATQGNFAYTAQYSTSIYFEGGFQGFSGTVTGLLSESTVDPLLAQALDYNGGYYDGMLSAAIPTYIEPGHVPEPATIGLFGLGLFGLAVSGRKSKKNA